MRVFSVFDSRDLAIKNTVSKKDWYSIPVINIAYLPDKEHYKFMKPTTMGYGKLNTFHKNYNEKNNLSLILARVLILSLWLSSGLIGS